MNTDRRHAHLFLPAAAALALASVACASAPPVAPMNLPFGDPARRERQAPLALDAITDTASGELITVEALAARLAPASLVFVGESHTSPDVHETQRRLIEALAASGRPVLIGLEMFPHAEQAALDRWALGPDAKDAGEGKEAQSEEDFLRSAHWYKHWGFDFRLYRDIFLLARARRLPLVGVNAPREVITAVRKKGFDKLTAEEAAHLPPPAQIDTTSEEHRRLFRAFFGEGDSAHGGLPDAAMEGMFRAQCTWDATMAYHAVKALEARKDPRAVMVVLLGSGHVAFGLGAPRQARKWFGGAIATVIPMPALGDDLKPERVRASYADYLWGLPPEALFPPYPTLGTTMADRKEVPHPVITEVGDGSPGAVAGLKPEDRVVSVDGAAVADKEAFLLAMSRKRWGDGAALVIERGGQQLSVNAALRRTTKHGGAAP
jgi:uncharacterized iron-regulated protein